MVSSDLLTDKNFLIYAIQNYKAVHCVSLEEFKEDLRRLKYLKKLITRYKETGELKERLILNHLIILNNMFGPEALSKILLLKMKAYLKYLKPFLLLLSILPERIIGVGDPKAVFLTSTIDSDAVILEALERI
jgi:hypothetical protein